MSRAELLINVLRNLFPVRSKGCIDSHNARLLLVYEESDSRSYMKVLPEQESTSAVGFLVKNSNQQAIYLLALDACFFRSDDPKRCDCLVFDESCLCFVELKLDVRRQATQKLRDAREQLGASITFFKTAVLPNSSSFGEYKLEAYAVMRDHVYPRASASRNTIFVQFLEQHGVELFERNTRSF